MQNGVGKTTYAFRHIRAVSGVSEFVNLDEIARGLSPLDVEAGRLPASRVAIARIRDLFQAGRTFSLETTLAGPYAFCAPSPGPNGPASMS